MDTSGPSDVFVNRDDPISVIRLGKGRMPSPSPSYTQLDNHEAEYSGAETPTQGKGLRGRFSALKEKANLQAGVQDRLLEKLLAQVLEGGDADDGTQPGVRAQAEKPNFNLPTMSNNFRRLNARIGVVFVFQAKVARLLAWQTPTHTISLLAIYTFICLDPYLLPLIPLTALLFGVMVPYFIARHPAADFSLSSEQAIGYSPRGPPLAPAVTVKPVKELSLDFFRNMRDLQNSMEDFSQAHDAIAALVVPRTNFSDEALSSALFVAVWGVCLVMSIAGRLLPYRLIALSAGWVAICAGHPTIAKHLETVHKTHVHPQQLVALKWMDRWIQNDVILDGAPETREVEIFELQRLSSAGEWEAWLFSAYPHDPMSPQRVSGERPVGTRFFEDVLPPSGWQWSEKKWALDLWSREWVEERIITGVEIETEGERWVYDIYDEKAANQVGIAEDYTAQGKDKFKIGPTWEEGEDYDGQRGEWRRRRWVRLVKRRNSNPGEG
ncbi:Integral peroxisomal membrane peroxin [Microdochium nivale]|nr:Integral peroxisomal membrane peroxin [Microdochium nivale]